MNEDQQHYQELTREHAALMRQRRTDASTFHRLANAQSHLLTELRTGPDYHFAYALRDLYLQAADAASAAADAHEAYALDYQAAS